MRGNYYKRVQLCRLLTILLTFKRQITLLLQERLIGRFYRSVVNRLETQQRRLKPFVVSVFQSCNIYPSSVTALNCMAGTKMYAKICLQQLGFFSQLFVEALPAVDLNKPVKQSTNLSFIQLASYFLELLQPQNLLTDQLLSHQVESMVLVEPPNQS